MAPVRAELQKALGPALAQTFAGWLATEAARRDKTALRSFLNGLSDRLPAPDRTLALRAVQAPLYRALADRAPDDAHRAGALNNLGNRLSALGRHEEALQATQEAVDIYRALAEQNPQAFRPDLAGSLGAHGTVLLALGRPGEAADAFREGLEALLPFAQALPQAYGSLLGALLEYYLRACKAAGQEPEAALVRQAEEILGASGGGQ